MTIWILAFLLFALCAGMGFLKGAIRSTVGLIGLIVGLFVAVPLGPSIKSLMPSIGIKNPLWIGLMPPVFIFILINLVFLGIAFGVHHKVMLFYKYKRDDLSRLRWERMNQRLGIVVGLVAGAIYFFLVSMVIYVGGYLTVQVAADDTPNPAYVKLLTKARLDMRETGLDKAIAALDSTPAKYYEASDVLGLLYHNPLLQGRLARYPFFLSLAERTEFQDIANDKEFNDLVFGKASVAAIIDHSRTQSILGSPEIMDELGKVDLKDLKEYLKTGKSPKYDEEKILGRWVLEKDMILTFVRKKKPDMKSKELLRLKKMMEMMPNVTLTATLDNKAIVKADGAPPAAAAAPSDAPAPAVAVPVNPQIARYPGRGGGGGGRGGASRPVATQPTAPAPPPEPVGQLSGAGTWKAGASQYELSIPAQGGKPQVFTGVVEDDELILTSPDITLIFVKD